MFSYIPTKTWSSTLMITPASLGLDSLGTTE